MSFLINGVVFNLCRPYQNEHSWYWAGCDTSSEPFPDSVCSCGAIRWKNKEHPEKELGEYRLNELKEAGLYK